MDTKGRLRLCMERFDGGSLLLGAKGRKARSEERTGVGLLHSKRSDLVGLNTYDEVVEFLERKIDDLHQQAYRIVEQHWASVRQMENKHPGWENKSSLQLRCEKQGNSIRLDWCGIKWYGSRAKGNRKPIRVHIAKPRGSHCYTISKLLVFAKEWEKALVEDTERRMAEIRREASHLVKAIASIRYARAVAAKSGGLDSERTREGL